MELKNVRRLKNGKYGGYIKMKNCKWKWSFISKKNIKGGLLHNLKKNCEKEFEKINSSDLNPKNKNNKKKFVKLYYAAKQKHLASPKVLGEHNNKTYKKISTIVKQIINSEPDFYKKMAKNLSEKKIKVPFKPIITVENKYKKSKKKWGSKSSCKSNRCKLQKEAMNIFTIAFDNILRIKNRQAQYSTPSPKSGPSTPSPKSGPSTPSPKSGPSTPSPKSGPSTVKLYYISKNKGAVEIMYDYRNSGKIGLVIAGNSALPGGLIGKNRNNLELNFKELNNDKGGGQEESIVRNWIHASSNNDKEMTKEFSKILGKWGVKSLPSEINTDNCKRMDNDTMVNYYNGEPVLYKQSFLVDDIKLTYEGEKFNASLIFTAGPNLCKQWSANDKGGLISNSYNWNKFSTLDLTLNVKMRHEYYKGNRDNFIEGIKCALYSSFVTMIKNDIKYAFIPKLSSAIYSRCMEGKNKGDNNYINELYTINTTNNIVSQTINKDYKGNPIKNYFELIAIVDIGSQNKYEINI
jgi:hypothetical protein